MSQDRRAVINAAAAGVQVLCVGAVLFVLYRFLYDALGIAAFGVWAVVLATTTALSVAGMGLGTSVVKFVAQYMARGDHDHVASIIQTATLSVAAALGAMLLLAYPALRWLIGVIISPPELLPEALAILPYAVGAFWLITIGTVFQGALDGVHRVDLRAGVIVIGQLVFLGLCWMLVPERGLVGVAQAQVMQGATFCILGWLVLQRSAPFLPAIPVRWRWSTFKEVIGYGANFQVISISTLLLDPVTKALLAKFGGVGLAGYYEMAYRISFYLRSLIVTVHQALVPTLASLNETAPERLPAIYRRSFHVIALFVAAALPFLVGATPLISAVWLGEVRVVFTTFASIILVAWFLNTLSNPAYFAFLGDGNLRWNVAGHLLTGILNVFLGIVLGMAFGGVGTVTAFAIAVVAGSSVVLISYQRLHDIDWGSLLQASTLLVAVIGVSALVLMRIFHMYLLDQFGSWWALIVSSVAYLVALALPLWTHPLRSYMLQIAFGTKASKRAAM
jgi:O-antigen/teichoic acid export membrane protein